jgi:DNA-binding MarR family transcriptional regulator
LNFLQSRNKREAPYSITQKGIADGVGIRWNHVPRAMGKLKKMGYITEEMSHIEEKTRRQKVYFLTDEGLVFARSLRERILAWKVTLQKSDGQEINAKLSEISSKLKLKLDPLKLYMTISDEGIIREEDLTSQGGKEAPSKGSKVFFKKGEITWPSELVGRDKEIGKVSEWLNSASINTIVIYGTIGIGKSALLAEMIKMHQGKKNIFWYKMSDSDSQDDLVESLSKFLIHMKKPNLSSQLKEQKELEDVMRVLEKGLGESETILAFDNYFQVSEEVADFFSSLCGLVQKYRNLKLIIGARDTTPFYCRFYDKSEVKKRKIAELTLKGLDREGIKQLLEAPNIDADALRKIDLMTRGHPLTIELIRKGDVNSLKRIKGFSRQEASLLLYLKGVESQ